MAKKKDATNGEKTRRSDPDMDVVKGVVVSGSAQVEEFEAYDRFSEHVVKNAKQDYPTNQSGPYSCEDEGDY